MSMMADFCVLDVMASTQFPIGDACYDWLFCGHWWKADSVCGWREGKSQDHIALWCHRNLERSTGSKHILNFWGLMQCVWDVEIQEFKPRKQGGEDPQLCSGLYSNWIWHKVINLKWYPARIFCFLAKGYCQISTGNYRCQKATLSHLT